MSSGKRVRRWACVRADVNTSLPGLPVAGKLLHDAPRSRGRNKDVHVTSPPHFVALGGTLRINSNTERALKFALDFAEERGASTALLTGQAINLPPYDPDHTERGDQAAALVAELRRADAVIVGSPGYHGGISGLVKNALDYVEDMSGDARTYFDGLPVGCIATGAGWQGAVATLVQIRSVVHALRGWPTPLGVAINTVAGRDPLAEPAVQNQLRIMVEQQLAFLSRGEGRD